MPVGSRFRHLKPAQAAKQSVGGLREKVHLPMSGLTRKPFRFPHQKCSYASPPMIRQYEERSQPGIQMLETRKVVLDHAHSSQERTSIIERNQGGRYPAIRPRHAKLLHRLPFAPGEIQVSPLVGTTLRERGNLLRVIGKIVDLHQKMDRMTPHRPGS